MPRVDELVWPESEAKRLHIVDYKFVATDYTSDAQFEVIDDGMIVSALRVQLDGHPGEWSTTRPMLIKEMKL